MTIRERYEEQEKKILSPKALCSANSQGRRLEEEPCSMRTCFQRDRDRIMHSKAFRRLKHKTQVFLSPEGDHYRTRLTHTLEVSQISRTVARALQLNEDLTEAIAVGHDLGHTPFGHAGEMELNEIHPGGFRHNVQSLRVVDHLERRKRGQFGLNLTYEVRDGILNHSGPNLPFTLEGQIVRLCDRIAYINHDIDDSIRAGVLKEQDLPEEARLLFGYGHGERIDTLLHNLVTHSLESGTISMTKEFDETFGRLRSYMFKNVYLNARAKQEEGRARDILRMLYEYFIEHPEAMGQERVYDYHHGDGVESIKDYVAGMSDRYAVSKYSELFLPKFWRY